MVEGAGTETAVAFRAQPAGWDIQAGMADMCPIDVRVAAPAGGLGVTGAAWVRTVDGRCRQGRHMAFLASGADTSFEVGAMTAVAGIEVGGCPVPEPGGSEGIRAGDAECRRNLQDRRMGGVGDVAGFTAGRQAAQNNIETRIAAGPAAGIVGMTGLAEGQVGLGGCSVLGRIGPSGRVTDGAMTEGAVKTTGSAICVGGYDRCSEIGALEMALSTDSGIQTPGIIHRTGMRRVWCGRPPGKRSMGSVHGQSVTHMTGAVRPAGREAADYRRATREIGPVTDLAACKAFVGTWLGFGDYAVLGGVDPACRMQAAVAKGIVETAGSRSGRLHGRCRQVCQESAACMTLGAFSSVPGIGGGVQAGFTGRPVFGMRSANTMTGKA